ncbi:MAG: ComF family protein [Kiritimatiellia bacterium]|jgi:competence protein ComFC
MNLRGVLDLLYPPRCAVCGASSPAPLCGACRADIHVRAFETCCRRCGKVLMESASAGEVAPLCAPCRSHPPKFDLARSAAEFHGPVRELVHGLKYHRATWLRDELADLLEGCYLAHCRAEAPDVVCPVPLNRVKQRERQYNQAELLAEALARRIGVPLVSNILERHRNTPTQTHLDAAARRLNVAGAFVSPPHLRPWTYGRCILLVDDVMTTGATLSECAAALKANGAERVVAITVARD